MVKQPLQVSYISANTKSSLLQEGSACIAVASGLREEDFITGEIQWVVVDVRYVIALPLTLYR